MTDLTPVDAAAAVADPRTSRADLFAITEQHPSLWAQIAAHPNAYPGLLEWLGTVGDDNVKSIVAARLSGAEAQPLAAVPAAVPRAPWPPDPPVRTDSTMVAPVLPAVRPVSQAPGPRSRRSAIAKVAVILVAAMLVGGGGTYLVIKLTGLGSTQTQSPSGQPATSAGSTTSPTASASPTATPATGTKPPTPTPTPTKSADPQVAALENITAQVASDSTKVTTTLKNQWTTLLSSKKDGLVWQGKTWRYTDIWNEFTQLKARYPAAVLVQDGNYASFMLGNEWYSTASGVVFSDPDTALAWCDSQQLDNDHCFAFRIADTTSGNQKERPR